MTDTRFAVNLPQLLHDGGPDLLARFARRAEELGFSGLWTLDSAPGGPTAAAPLLDGLHALTYAAAVTESASLGIAVIVLPRRNPVTLAKELASLDQLSAGRLVVGVGLGAASPEVQALGFPIDRRVRRFNEAVEIMRALWRDAEVDHQGEVWRLDGLRMDTKPVQRPGPPVWLGAGSEPALRRAARIADGWIGSGSSSSADFAAQAQLLDAALSDEGRDAAAFAKAKRVYIAVEDDEPRARKRLAAALDGMYARPGLAERCGVCGPPEACAQVLRELIAAGARELVLHPLHEPLEQLERLAEVVQLARA